VRNACISSPFTEILGKFAFKTIIYSFLFSEYLPAKPRRFPIRSPPLAREARRSRISHAAGAVFDRGSAARFSRRFRFIEYTPKRAQRQSRGRKVQAKFSYRAQIGVADISYPAFVGMGRHISTIFVDLSMDKTPRA
jgi:hypothetical protein